MSSSSKDFTLYDSLYEVDNTVHFYRIENGKKVLMKNTDFTFEFLTGYSKTSEPILNRNGFPAKTFIEESILLITKEVLPNVDMNVLSFIAKKTSCSKEIITKESLFQKMDNLSELVQSFKTEKKNETKKNIEKKEKYHEKKENILKIIENIWFFDNFIFPPIIKNILDHLEVLNSMFSELKIMHNYVEIKGWDAMCLDERLEIFLIVKHSAEIYSSKFNCFLENFKAWITNEIIFRHYGKKERYRINYDTVFFQLYNHFFNHFCNGSSKTFLSFIQNIEHFNFIINSKQYKTKRPSFLNDEVVYKQLYSKKQLIYKQELFSQFLDSFIKLITFIYGKVNNESSLETSSLFIYGVLNNEPCRIDLETDKLTDLSLFDYMKLENNKKFMAMFPFFESWISEKNIYIDFQVKKFNQI